jgi:hypothetical protein
MRAGVPGGWLPVVSAYSVGFVFTANIVGSDRHGEVVGLLCFHCFLLVCGAYATENAESGKENTQENVRDFSVVCKYCGGVHRYG